MPRRKGNNQTTQSTAVADTPVIFAKCKGCQVSGELRACEFCQYPECATCMGKHRTEDKLSQGKVMLKTKTDSLRQQTVLKNTTLERSIEIATKSLDVLRTTNDTFARALTKEYHTYEQKLAQSQTTNKQHIDDLKRMWIELEKNAAASAENYEQTNEIVNQIEASPSKKHIQLCFQLNTLSPSLGCLNESLSDPISSDLVLPKEPPSSIQPSSELKMIARSPNVDGSSPPATMVEANGSEDIESMNHRLEALHSAPLLTEQQRLLNSQEYQRDNSPNKALGTREFTVSTKLTIATSTQPKTSSESITSTAQAMLVQAVASTEPVRKSVATLIFNRLKKRPTNSVRITEGQRMASNDEYFLVCPKDKLCLLDTQGKQHLIIERDFDVSDICWSTYLKRFLILTDDDLYSLDPSREHPLMVEISKFSRNMDECTCYDNILMVITDCGGAEIELWDMGMNWKCIKRYEQPISCEEGQGICSIRFSSSGTYLGVTLTEPGRRKAYFQLRNWQDMEVLQIVEQPFYEGYCNHYMLALPNDGFLVYKYSEKKMFFFDSNGQQKHTFLYPKGICSIALLTKDKNCLVIQTRRPDELYFYDV